MHYLNNYRGIAILLVVFSHAVSILTTYEPGFLKALAPFYHSGTLLFVLAAGYFFAAMFESYSYFPFLKNKLKQLVMPYVLLSLPAALVYVFGLKTTHSWVDMTWFHSLGTVEAYIFMLITGAQLGPLWFVPMIFVYYLLSPVWAFLLQKNLLIPVFCACLASALYFGRPPNNSRFLEAGVYFLPPYLLGMWMHSTPWLSKVSESKAATGFALSALMLLTLGERFSGAQLLAGLLAAFFLIALCRTKFNYKVKSLDLLARLSFYIFIMHGYMVGFFRSALAEGLYDDTTLTLIILAVFVLTITTCILLYVPLKILLRDRSKYFLGA